jgi:hypothetical protein
LTVCEWFGLKTTRTVLAGLTSKQVATVFSSLASKLVAMVSWLSLKTKVVKGFSVWASNWQLRCGDLSIKITVTVS